ncbi:MAG: glycosyltransferase family 4 protein [Cytophagia bacterium]|jgi:L-malate glycosyltransferase|nr:glycosyltransferase family 4 protein [Cytophagia bacterium]
MRVLWLVNNIFPELFNALESTSLVKSPISGSWMYALSECLKKVPDIEIFIVSVYKGKRIKNVKIKNINYYLLPCSNKTKYHKHLEQDFSRLNTIIKPDVIHIHGTEFPHSLAFIKGCGVSNVIVSIQGLISVIERYYYSEITFKDIVKNLTPRNIVLFDGIIGQKHEYKRRGIYEKECISRVKYLIGRTSWDYTHSKTINNSVKYFHLNELLRKEFYNVERWNYEKCDKYSIFVSQASYPIKGLHNLIKALSIVKKKYPNFKLFVAGPDFVSNSTLYQKLAYSGYGKYIKKLIKEIQLENNIEFLGRLDANQMISNYLKCNVYVLPSSIENSPNSLSEAQIIGTPTIATDVGGVRELTFNGSSAFLYRFEEYEILASLIVNVFNCSKGLTKILNETRILTMERHSEKRIISSLLDIYNTIAK